MFNKALNGGVKRSKVITVMKMPIVLRAALGAGGDIRMQGDLFQKMAGKHEFSQEAFAAFPESLFDPIGVFYDRTKENHVVIVDVKVPNQEGVIKNAMVAIEVKADKNGAEVCDIITAFSPNKSDYLKKFISNPVYVDKKRAEVWAGAEEGNILQLLSTALSELGSEVIIRDKLAEVNDKIYQIAHEDDVHFAERLRVAVAALGNDEFMKAPNGMPSKLTPNQWTQVRTQAFRKWFGDWEKVATFRSGVEKLQAMESVANITGKEFEPTGKNDLVQRMVDYWAQHGNVAHNPMLGDVKLDTRSAKDSIAHGVGRIKAAAFAAVHDVIERGVFIEHAADWKGRGKDSYVFAAPISINGEEHICEAIVMKDANRTGFYLHEVQVKEKLLDVFKTGLYTGTSGAPRSILLQVMGRVKDIEKKCSKIVDENGEPLVVYHGTVHGGFRVFDVNGRGKTEGSGAFFTSDKRVAQGYGSVFHAGGAEPQVYACFLNIREPYVVDFEGNSWNRVPGRAAGYFVHYDNGESEWFSNKEDADFEISGYEGKAEIEEDWEESPTLDDLAREVWEESPEVDGIIAENVVDAAVGAGKSYPATDYIVASPNQIKSATENRGTYSALSDDISMSVSEEAADRVGGMLGDAGVAARSNGAFVRQMEAELRQCMERARAYGAATKGEREAALVAMGSAAQLVTAATAFLPKGYRVNVQHTARQLQVLAELATSGEVDFTRELASQDLKRFAARTKRRLDKRGLDAVEQVLDDKRMEGIELPDDAALDDVLKEFGKQRFMAVFEKLVGDVTSQLRRHARDKVVEKMRALLERVRPKHDSKTGSMKNKGGMSADANREMELIEAAMGMNAETLQAELAGLAARESAAETEEAAAEIQEKMAIFSTFGNMDGMSYENAQGAYEALLFRVRLNRFAWADKMARQKVERNMAAAAVVEGLGRAGVNEYHDVKVKKPILAQIKDFPLAVASLPHVFYALQGVPALKPLMRQLARRCNNAGENVKIWDRERWMRLEMMSRATLGKSWRRAMNELHEQLNTGVAFDKPIYREFTIRTGYLRELLAMSAAERAEHFAAAKREGGLAAMSVYSERDLKEAAEKLADMEAVEGERAEVKVKYVKEMKHEDDLRMSRGEALYVILMFEQPTYTERMMKQGFTFEVIEGLRDFVGRESFLKFGYGLRELFAEQGERLAKVYEDVYGVPFPREENYFAARWLRHGQQDSTPEALLGGMAGQPGAATGFLKPRVDHDLEIDTNQDAVAVFLQSTRLSDCWMATQGVVADMRALMRNREFAEAMTAKLGAETYSNLRDWVNVLEGANMQEVVQMKGVEELMRRAYGSGAITMLGFVLRTMIRQTPSFFNGLLGAADISTVEWFTAMARIKRGEAPMSFRRMRKSVFMQQRRAGDVAELQRQAMETEHKTPWINNLLQAAMAPLEKLDAFWTAHSLVPVWNVYYSRAREAGMSHEDAEAEAWEQTKLAANMASQPIGWLNKSKWVQKRNPLVRSMFYMLSEDVNKTALCWALWKGGHRRAAVRAWLVYGAANAFVSVLLDCWTGDPKDWEKAHWWEYVLSAVYGPLASMPCVGELLEELGHCVLYGAGTLADAMGADRETVKELQKARGRATVGRVLFDAGRTYRSVKKMYGFMTDNKKHGLWDYTKAAKGAMAPVAIGAGATGTAFGYWAMAASVIGNAVDSGARVYRNIEHRMR